MRIRLVLLDRPNKTLFAAGIRNVHPACYHFVDFIRAKAAFKSNPQELNRISLPSVPLQLTCFENLVDSS
jgi:hypothetical protein